MEQVGECLNAYWAVKKVLAEGSEPESILPILEATKPLSFGQVATQFYYILKS